MLRCRVVTFDMVNTVLKVIGSPGIQYSEVALQHGVRINPDHIMQVYRPMFHQMKQDYPLYGVQHNINTKQWWDIFVRRIFTKVGKEQDDMLLAGISESLWERFSDGGNWEVLPHSTTVFDMLKRQGFTLGAVSNFDDRLENTLRKQKIRDYFDFVVTVVSAKAEKPDPRIFQAVLDQASVDPEDVVHVGDDVRDDYHGARNFGMKAILFDAGLKFIENPGKYNVKKEYIVNDMRQLPDYLLLS